MGMDQTPLGLAPQLDLRAARPLAGDLLSARGSDVRLDASAVERLGAQCLQVLLSAAATWRADGVNLQIEDPSPAFCDALAIAGIELDELTAAGDAAADHWRA